MVLFIIPYNKDLLKLTFHCFYCYSHFNTQNFVFVGPILFYFLFAKGKGKLLVHNSA